MLIKNVEDNNYAMRDTHSHHLCRRNTRMVGQTDGKIEILTPKSHPVATTNNKTDALCEWQLM